MIVPIIAVASLILFTVHYFGITLHIDGVSSRIDAVVMFSKADFQLFLLQSIRVGIALGVSGLVWYIVKALFLAVNNKFVWDFRSILVHLSIRVCVIQRCSSLSCILSACSCSFGHFAVQVVSY